MAFHKVALFGANGQIGDTILRALLEHDFDISAFIPPQTELSSGKNNSNITVKSLDLNHLTREGLAANLRGVEVVVSALNGEALAAQSAIQDAAADAGVKRFYPSEYGMHNTYRKPNDPWGYIHPMWEMKAEVNEKVVFHPAVLSGKMSYTVIGCGDFYNQDREKIWCPWTQTDVDEYTFHIVDSPDARAQYTHLDDLGKYLAATLLHPHVSENQYLNFPSDTISHQEIAKLLGESSGKPVKMEAISWDEVHQIVADPAKAPRELAQSAFPVDFWLLVKGSQAQGRFVRPPGQTHNHLFPDIEPTTFEEYFKQRFSQE